MGNLWLKIKVGTKIAVFAILSVAVLVFLVQNINKPVKVWFWNEIETTLLKAIFFTSLISVVFTILLGTTFRTLRQIKELRARTRSAKLENEVADMRAKAAMLQTKPAARGNNPGVMEVTPPPNSDPAQVSMRDAAGPSDEDAER